MAVKGSLRQAVLKAVLGGASTPDAILAVVGGQISAAQAMNGARRQDALDTRRKASGRRRGQGPSKRTAQAAVHRGKKILIDRAVRSLVKFGLVRHVSRGVYGPPLPKVYEPPSQAG